MQIGGLVQYVYISSFADRTFTYLQISARPCSLI